MEVLAFMILSELSVEFRAVKLAEMSEGEVLGLGGTGKWHAQAGCTKIFPNFHSVCIIPRAVCLPVYCDEMTSLSDCMKSQGPVISADIKNLDLKNDFELIYPHPDHF